MNICLYPKCYISRWKQSYMKNNQLVNSETYIFKPLFFQPYIAIKNRMLKDIFIDIKLINLTKF